MRTSTLARAGAVITASALAFSLGAGPVSAAETASASASSTESTSKGIAATAVKSGEVSAQSAFTSFRISNGVLYRKSGNQVRAKIGFNFTKQPSSISTGVTVNGRARGSIALPYSNLVELPAAVGPGRVVLGPTIIRYADGTSEVLATRSNSFFFRRDTFGKLKVRHAGKKVRVAIRAQIRGADGKKASAKRATLQYKKGRKWKTLKKVRINSKGKATYNYSTKSKRKYRLVVKKTATVKGMRITLKRKV